MTLPRLAILGSLVTVAIVTAIAAGSVPSGPSERVGRIAAELRCPVCQGLSIADSPSQTAVTMRDLVAQRVAEGRTDEEIRDEFRRSYGDWVFLAPPAQSAAALMWLLPVALVAAGGALAWGRVRRSAPAERDPPPTELQALRARVAREEAADR